MLQDNSVLIVFPSPVVAATGGSAADAILSGATVLVDDSAVDVSAVKPVDSESYVIEPEYRKPASGGETLAVHLQEGWLLSTTGRPLPEQWLIGQANDMSPPTISVVELQRPIVIDASEDWVLYRTDLAVRFSEPVVGSDLTSRVASSYFRITFDPASATIVNVTETGGADVRSRRRGLLAAATVVFTCDIQVASAGTFETRLTPVADIFDEAGNALPYETVQVQSAFSGTWAQAAAAVPPSPPRAADLANGAQGLSIEAAPASAAMPLIGVALAAPLLCCACWWWRRRRRKQALKKKELPGKVTPAAVGSHVLLGYLDSGTADGRQQDPSVALLHEVVSKAIERRMSLSTVASEMGLGATMPSMLLRVLCERFELQYGRLPEEGEAAMLLDRILDRAEQLPSQLEGKREGFGCPAPLLRCAFAEFRRVHEQPAEYEHEALVCVKQRLETDLVTLKAWEEADRSLALQGKHSNFDAPTSLLANESEWRVPADRFKRLMLLKGFLKDSIPSLPSESTRKSAVDLDAAYVTALPDLLRTALQKACAATQNGTEPSVAQEAEYLRRLLARAESNMVVSPGDAVLVVPNSVRAALRTEFAAARPGKALLSSNEIQYLKALVAHAHEAVAAEGNTSNRRMSCTPVRSVAAIAAALPVLLRSAAQAGYAARHGALPDESQEVGYLRDAVADAEAGRWEELDKVLGTCDAMSEANAEWQAAAGPIARVTLLRRLRERLDGLHSSGAFSASAAANFVASLPPSLRRALALTFEAKHGCAPDAEQIVALFRRLACDSEAGCASMNELEQLLAALQQCPTFGRPVEEGHSTMRRAQGGEPPLLENGPRQMVHRLKAAIRTVDEITESPTDGEAMPPEVAFALGHEFWKRSGDGPPATHSELIDMGRQIARQAGSIASLSDRRTSGLHSSFKSTTDCPPSSRRRSLGSESAISEVSEISCSSYGYSSRKRPRPRLERNLGFESSVGMEESFMQRPISERMQVAKRSMYAGDVGPVSLAALFETTGESLPAQHASRVDASREGSAPSETRPSPLGRPPLAKAQRERVSFVGTLLSEAARDSSLVQPTRARIAAPEEAGVATLACVAAQEEADSATRARIAAPAEADLEAVNAAIRLLEREPSLCPTPHSAPVSEAAVRRAARSSMASARPASSTSTADMTDSPSSSERSTPSSFVEPLPWRPCADTSAAPAPVRLSCAPVDVDTDAGGALAMSIPGAVPRLDLNQEGIRPQGRGQRRLCARGVFSSIAALVSPRVAKGVTDNKARTDKSRSIFALLSPRRVNGALRWPSAIEAQGNAESEAVCDAPPCAAQQVKTHSASVSPRAFGANLSRLIVRSPSSRSCSRSTSRSSRSYSRVDNTSEHSLLARPSCVCSSEAEAESCTAEPEAAKPDSPVARPASPARPGSPVISQSGQNRIRISARVARARDANRLKRCLGNELDSVAPASVPTRASVHQATPIRVATPARSAGVRCRMQPLEHAALQPDQPIVPPPARSPGHPPVAPLGRDAPPSSPIKAWATCPTSTPAPPTPVMPPTPEPPPNARAGPVSPRAHRAPPTPVPPPHSRMGPISPRANRSAIGSPRRNADLALLSHPTANARIPPPPPPRPATAAEARIPPPPRQPTTTGHARAPPPPPRPATAAEARIPPPPEQSATAGHARMPPPPPPPPPRPATAAEARIAPPRPATSGPAELRAPAPSPWPATEAERCRSELSSCVYGQLTPFRSLECTRAPMADFPLDGQHGPVSTRSPLPAGHSSPPNPTPRPERSLPTAPAEVWTCPALAESSRSSN